MDREWVWQSDSWPDFRWDAGRVRALLDSAHAGLATFRAALSGREFRRMLEHRARLVTLEAVGTAGIEGTQLDPDSVRSCVARQLGLEARPSDVNPASMEIEGLVQVLLDAGQNAASPLTRERLLGWHAAIFPAGSSGTCFITPGAFRATDTPTGVMPGRMIHACQTGQQFAATIAAGPEPVRYMAPPADRLDSEIDSFLQWFETPTADLDCLVMAAVAHFRLVTIHPFDDGNGRIARAVANVALGRALGQTACHPAVSAAVMKDRWRYHDELRRASRGDCDLTGWIEWFLECVVIAVDDAMAA